MRGNRSAKPASRVSAGGLAENDQLCGQVISEANPHNPNSQVRRGRGRPRGSAALKRKSLVLQYCALKYFSCDTVQSAKVAAAFVANAAFVVTRYSDNVASFKCEPAGLENRTKYLRKSYEKELAALSPDDRLWLETSAGQLRLLFLAITNRANSTAYFAMTILNELGWADDIARFFDRCSAAVLRTESPELEDTASIAALEEEFNSPASASGRALIPIDPDTGSCPTSNLLFGCQAIGDHLGLTETQVRHMNDKKLLPTFKMNGRVCARAPRLDIWLAERELKS